MTEEPGMTEEEERRFEGSSMGLALIAVAVIGFLFGLLVCAVGVWMFFGGPHPTSEGAGARYGIGYLVIGFALALGARFVLLAGLRRLKSVRPERRGFPVEPLARPAPPPR